RVAAVRDGSPAEKAQVQAQNQEVEGQKVEGDTIKSVEVEENDGQKTRWVRTRSAMVPEAVVEKDLDPIRLPYDLQKWADRKTGRKQSRLTVLEKAHHQAQPEVLLEADWDDRFRYDQDLPIRFESPLALPGLGLAYYVDTTVEAVMPDSPATRAVAADQ